MRFLSLFIFILMLLDHLSDSVVSLGLKFVLSLILDAGLLLILFLVNTLVLLSLHLLEFLLAKKSLLLVCELVSRFDRLFFGLHL